MEIRQDGLSGKLRFSFQNSTPPHRDGPPPVNLDMASAHFDELSVTSGQPPSPSTHAMDAENACEHPLGSEHHVVHDSLPLMDVDPEIVNAKAPDAITDSFTAPPPSPSAHAMEAANAFGHPLWSEHRIEHDSLPVMDVDSEIVNGKALDSVTDSFAAPLPLDPSTGPTLSVLSKTLSSLGIRVDPIFNLTICLFCKLPINYLAAHPHYISNHKPPMHPRSCIPSKDEIDGILLQLKADCQKPVAPGPIHPIPGLEIFDALKCQIPGCTSPFVFSDKRRFNEHCVIFHKNVDRLSSKVKAHKLSNMRTAQQMVEIIPISTPNQESLVDDLERQLASFPLYSLPDVFLPSSNERSKGALFAQLGWDQLLVGVRIGDLRATVTTPPDSDPCSRLVSMVQSYYASISPLIPTLPVLTARAILSTGELGSQPFKTVQEKDTLKRYSSLMALFLIFLLRHMTNPVLGFSVPFNEAHLLNLSSLRAMLEDKDADGHEEQIHRTIIALLEHLSRDALLSDRKDLLTLFLVAYHLKDDAGNTTRVSVIPPRISAIQWCLRASAVRELLSKAPLYDGDTYK